MLKNFAQKTPIYFGEAFEIPKDFHEKSFVSGFGAEAPTDYAYTQKRLLAESLFLYVVFDYLKEETITTYVCVAAS